MSRPATAASPPTPSSAQQQQPPHNSAQSSRTSFYNRFARRPRTSVSTELNPSSPFAASTSSLLSPGSSSFFSPGLPRSSSSSHVPLPLPEGQIASSSASASRPSRVSLQSRITSPILDRDIDTRSSSNMTTANTSGGQGAGGSAFGRMFRRYSQGQNASGRADSQRPSTRDRDMSRNVSSSALPRESIGSSPARNQNVPPSLPRSNSAGFHSVARSSGENGIISNSRTMAPLPDAPESQPSQGISSQAAAVDLEANPSQENGVAAAGDRHDADGAAGHSRPMNNVHRIRLVPHLEATRSLHFEPIERDVKEGDTPVKVGRFTDRQPSQPDANNTTVSGAPAATEANHAPFAADTTASNVPSRGQPGARGGAIPMSGSHGGGGRIDSSRIAFKSKVVSRGHAEVWCEPGGKFFIRDTKSSSGTFLNHIRLSGPNLESRPFSIKDGDIIQLGVDYQGGTEEIYRCVKMRVELNRGWQREATQFNVNALRQLRALQGTSLTPSEEKGKSTGLLPTNRQGVSVTDCCICLFSVTVCQALFIAPCSHVFHYKCIRPLLNLHYPGFSCPLCRTFADLDADVEEDEAWQEALMKEAAAAEARIAEGQPPLDVGTPAVELDAPITANALLPSPALDANDHTRVGAGTGSATRPSAAAIRATSSLASAPVLADVHASGSPPSVIGRGTAVLNKRKNDWARPDTAVGSSAGPIAEDDTFALNGTDREADSTHVSRLASEVDEMVVADHLLNDNVTGMASPARRSSHTSMNASPPIRRESGPIAIGGARSRDSQHRAHPSAQQNLVNGNGSSDEGWPSVAAVGGFSPGLEESGTPLNHTFLSTLAEAPRINAAQLRDIDQQDFHSGRTAPARNLVPANPFADRPGSGDPSRRDRGSQEQESSAEALDHSYRRNRSSDGGEDVDTAEEEQGGPSLSSLRVDTSDLAAGKGKAKVDARSESDPSAENIGFAAFSVEGKDHGNMVQTPPHSGKGEGGGYGLQRGRSRSRGRKETGVIAVPSPSDYMEDPTHQVIVPPRTGPNLNASAYMPHHTSHSQQSHGPGYTQHSPSNHDRSVNPTTTPSQTTTTTSPTSPSESKMAKFKRRISHAM